MGNRVYDPIHDVFQTQLSDNEHEPEHEHENEHQMNVEQDHDDNVPSVTTSRKKMKESSKYNRHLKKPDGEYFNRADVQLHFLRLLLSDKRLLFTNIYKDFYRNTLAPIQLEGEKVVNVTDTEFDARTFIFNDKLTFSQSYVLSIATSTKCSKILKEKLLKDKEIAFSACALGFLVNLGRLNTTINFFHEMTSQLRTFHSVPCLQMNNEDPKALQDTPRLKSILKSLSVGNDPIDLVKVYDREEIIEKRVNLINLIFTICDNVSLLNIILLKKYVNVDNEFSSLFSLLDVSTYNPVDRCNIMLWLLYVHSETDMSDESVKQSLDLFKGEFKDEEKLQLRISDKNYDIDPPEEIQYGLEQMEKRRAFLAKQQGKEKDKEPIAREEEQEPKVLETEPESQVVNPTKPEPKKHEIETEKEDIKPPKKKTKTKREVSVDSMLKSRSPSKEKEVLQRGHLAKSWIDADNNKSISKGLDVAKSITQQQFLKDLINAQNYTKMKRKELGLMKAFNEFEDISLASLLGVRGRKRKKFKDNLLGFETDYLKYFGLIKRKILAYESQHNTKDHVETKLISTSDAETDSDAEEYKKPVFRLPN